MGVLDLNIPELFSFPKASLFLIMLSHFYLFSLILVSGSWKKREISRWNLTFSKLH